MKLLKEENSSGFTDVIKFNASQIVAAGTGVDIRVGVLPPGATLTDITVLRTVAQTGTSTNLTLNVGTTAGTANEFISATNLSTLVRAAYSNGVAFTIGGDAGTGKGVVNNTNVAQPVLARFTFTGTVLAGEWVIAWNILDPNTIVA